MDENQIVKFDLFNPGQKRRDDFWNSRKEQFVCATVQFCYQLILLGCCKEKSQCFNYLSLILIIYLNYKKILEQLLKIYENQKDQGRIFGYRKAIAVLRAQKKEIKTIEDVQNIKGIGGKIKLKIQEILETGKLQKAENLMVTLFLLKNWIERPKELSYRFVVLSGNLYQLQIILFSEELAVQHPLVFKSFIIEQQQIELYEKGIKSIEQLRENQHYLTNQQKIGLKYYEEIQQRMCRDEAKQIIQVVQNEINTMEGIPNPYEAIACGSYRRYKKFVVYYQNRLKETNGDVDIIITRKDGKPFTGFLQKLIHKTQHYCSETYMGICQLSKTSLHRRIDLKIYPREQFGYAVLYFTGSAHFNRSMRLFARKKGYSLSDHGLYLVNRIKNQKVWTGVNIPCYTEEDVFKVLQLDYRPPWERDL